MGGLPCCELDASKMTISLLKNSIEGDRKKVKDNAPETYVTIEEVMLKDEGAVTFSPAAFTLKGLHFRVLVEMVGSSSEIAKEVGAEAAKGMMNKAGLGEGAQAALGNAADKAGAGISAMKNKMGATPQPKAGQEIKSFVVKLTVDMNKDMNNDDVQVTVRDLETDVKAMQSALNNPTIKKHIENGISRKVSEVAQEKMAKK
eukprot:gnl/MRDRNA2_/MRDRNA2_93110_c0_seq1.p1 gnl/MRDRNA2_/MRDRNA2_93110_c0~~gnl/MRDRNA2_/MRDRNA2_93110_c0_seq1.p1  ORF type:complete len:202 (+),score=61.96 gnl/MRDRNA2_/MRDRNA2_93110_c0_seq1:106-711(+)